MSTWYQLQCPECGLRYQSPSPGKALCRWATDGCGAEMVTMGEVDTPKNQKKDE